jgi:uncharacterized DUF497 family protein
MLSEIEVSFKFPMRPIGDSVIRIISARRANKKETRDYRRFWS